MATYTRTELKQRMNAGIKNKIGVLTDPDNVVNQAVREVLSDYDLRSTKRTGKIFPGLFDQVYEYPAFADLKQRKVASLRPLLNEKSKTYDFITNDQFQENRKPGTFTIADNDLIRKFLVVGNEQGATKRLSSLDSLTDGGGLWTAFGDAANVEVNDSDYVEGNGAIEFDINNVGGTTAGIVNTGLTPFDYSLFLAGGDVAFIYVDLHDETEITSFTLRIGSDSSNYHELTVTATHEGTAFQNGWNLLRFDLENAVDVGAPVSTAGTYVAIFMNKLITKVSQPSFKFDDLTLKTGDVHLVQYYSKFGWLGVDGVRKENSTQDDDYLVCDFDEFQLFIDKSIEIAGNEVDEDGAAAKAMERYMRNGMRYSQDNPSDALYETHDYQAQYYV